ncbi:hypothetical protein AURDEDRAFT_71532 [Auricularia subglabra TFB-10046 SS5]|uniref:tRNA ligase n=1 Tax=Auricularia subglabra (strain TFB-10046 / SS5) TaxID=717982 RepID=J0WX38_AURST|nr:hypothetical protein AURDEDRAFT_71532 [Auricularia subglabra TFB-10046 SS5]
MTHSSCPIAPDQLAEHTALVSRMHVISARGRQLITSSYYDAPSDVNIRIRSWKMNEHRYYQVPSPFPTLARGVFTQWLPGRDGQPEGEEGGHWRIVARGYDKFFNIGETAWTSWSSLEAHTEAPYHLTLKSNGCIIFVAALTPDKLLVTSKHSLGPLQGFPMSHAQMGERWLDRHLESVGKTQAELAARLWKDNWTVVCELCDDSFEEHVLPIATDKTGLHLHGINASQAAFHTQPPEFLQAFAKEWGLIPTAYVTLDSVAEVLKFTNECAKTGSWNGEAIEGFVVRTHVKEQSQNELTSSSQKSAPPYPQGSSLFFKVKFDEPYMMYRDFREVTRTLLRGTHNGAVPQSKLRRLETRVYKLWVEREIQRDLKQFDGFMQCRGIIATRDRFFAWLKTPAGQEALAAEQGTQSSTAARAVTTIFKNTAVGSAPSLRSKWIIVPVAIPGCGKTAIAVALADLFGFAHTQSDDVKARKPAPIFLTNVARLLDWNDIVIADKNNHLFQHRSDLRRAVARIRPPVKLLALNWSTTNLPRSTVHRVCADRIASRGENHQSLIPGDYGTHEDVLWRFLRDTNDLEDGEVDASIEMDVEEGLEEALARAVDGVVRVLGLPEPSQEQIGKALGRARTYQAASKATHAPPRIEATRYYALLPEADIASIASRRIRAADAPKALKDLWESACAHADEKNTLVVVRPHVTLVHEKGLAAPEEQALWDHCAALAPDAAFCLRFDTLVYNGRVLAVVVGEIRPGEEDESAGAFVQELSQSVRSRLHITVARRDASVAPVEAKALVETWRKSPGGVDAIALWEPVDVLARVRGFAR